MKQLLLLPVWTSAAGIGELSQICGLFPSCIYVMTIAFYRFSEWENTPSWGVLRHCSWSVIYPISVQKLFTNHHLKAGSAKPYTAFFIWLVFVVHIQAAVTSKSCCYSKREVCKSCNKNLKKIICFSKNFHLILQLLMEHQHGVFSLEKQAKLLTT